MDGSVVTLRAVYRTGRLRFRNASRDGYVLDGWCDGGVYGKTRRPRNGFLRPESAGQMGTGKGSRGKTGLYGLSLTETGANGGSMSAIEGIEYEQEIAPSKEYFRK